MSAADFLLQLGRSSAAAGVLVILVLIVQRVFRRQLSPQWHCALWLVVAARLLPFSISSAVSLFNLGPRAIFAETDAASVRAFVADAIRGASSSSVPIDPAASTSSPSVVGTSFDVLPVAESRWAHWDPPTLLLAAWLAGVAVLAIYVLGGAYRFARHVRRMRPVEDPALLDMLADCCARMGVRTPPTALTGNAVTSPALYGVWRPRLLLPEGFSASLSPEEQRFVLLHELAHLRRRDLLLNWVMTALQLAHWFNPLVWLALARWRIDREIACDATAIAAAGAAQNRAYGRTMLRLLENVSDSPSRFGVLGILEDKRQLKRRMKMIAGFTPARQPLAAVGVLAILALVGLTDAQVASSPLAPATPSGGPQPPAAAISPRAVDQAIADQFAGDRKKLLEHLHANGLTMREYRRSMVAKLQARASESPTPAATPQSRSSHVLIVVNGSAAMIAPGSRPAQADAESGRIERGRTYVEESTTMTDAEKRSTAPWKRTAQALHAALTALAPGTSYQVMVVRDTNALSLGEGVRAASGGDVVEIGITRRLLEQTPAGRFDLELAFGSAALPTNGTKPDRVILITNGLPTAGAGVPRDDGVSEAQRIKLFETATKALLPRVPVQTVLLPQGPGDPAAAGLYWELANATRGSLTCPAGPDIAPRTHLAFVIDTSGSMRDPNHGGVWPIALDTIDATLDANPQLQGVQFLDGDGRFILRRESDGTRSWLPHSPETRAAIRDALRNYKQDSVSNPVPGVSNAFRFLHDRNAPEMRMGIYILGDEYNSSDRAESALEKIAALNPRDASGRRAVTISAIGFPTTIRYQFSMGNTGLRFANLMRQLTAEHDGSFVALPDL